MPLNPPIFFPNIGYRWVCDNCGERWHEDNVLECVWCKRDICPNCGRFESFPWRKDNEWWCDRDSLGYRGVRGLGPNDPVTDK